MKKDDILSLEKRWASLKKRYGPDAYKQIPVPVIYAQALEDAEHITYELSRFIYDEEILPQREPLHEQYLVHSISYPSQNESFFKEIHRLSDFIKGTGDHYTGVLLIDVSEWQGHYQGRRFNRILSYLSNLRLNGLVLFFYMNLKNYNPETRMLDAVISSYFRSARVVFEISDLQDFMISELANKGIVVDKRTSFYLERFITKASGSPLFHGTDSIRNICEEIIQRYKSTQGRSGDLDESLLKGLFTASEYLNKSFPDPYYYARDSIFKSHSIK